jgi:nicotinate dehydrogenase subunit A
VLTLTVNDRSVEVRSDPEAPLLYALRNELGLKGSRFGCGDGLCGACTVLIDGVATPSCDLPVSAVVDRKILTVEGLGDEQRPHPLQAAILECQAAQCGFCLSGVLMHGAALLAANDAPTRPEIQAALDGVLCRCGAHERMIRSVARAAEILRDSR